MNDHERAKALFGALSIAISSCAPQVRPTANEPESALPVATTSATASAAFDASTPPAPPASDAPPPPSASATAKKPPPKRRPRVVEGRPFLVDGVARLAPAGAHAGWADAVDLEG